MEDWKLLSLTEGLQPEQDSWIVCYRLRIRYNSIEFQQNKNIFQLDSDQHLHYFRKECESYVKGFPGARYKKFSTEDEAESFVSGLKSSGSLTSAVAAPSVSVDKLTLMIGFQGDHMWCTLIAFY